MSHRSRRRDTFRARLMRWLLAGLLALAGHVVIGLFFALSGFFHLFSKVQPRVQAPPNPVAMRALPRSEWEANRQPRSEPNQRAPANQPKALAQQKPPEKKEPEVTPQGKVVDVAPGNKEKPKDDAEFLAESNNRVEKQTRSPDSTPFYQNAMPRPSTTVKPSEGQGHDAPDHQVIAGNNGQGNEEAPAKQGPQKQNKKAMELPSVKKRDRIALKNEGKKGHLESQAETEEMTGNSYRLRISPGGHQGEESKGSTGKRGGEELRTLTPSASVLDRIAGAPANDLTPMEDVEIGSGTYLNTREWKHASFFNRVKQNVGTHWDPNSVLRTRDPTGEIYLFRDRHTVVSVILGNDGALKSVFVDKSCGVDFLDSEAVAAFKRAQPFPNPPPALQDGRGEVRFSFGFYLEVEHGGMQMFRPAR